MPRLKTGNAALSLLLFADDEPSTKEAWEIVERIPLCARFVSERKRCRGACCRAEGARGHGPYWFARWDADGVARRAYIGSDERKRRVDQAHAIVRADIESANAAAAAAAETPELRRARELAHRAGMRRVRDLRAADAVASADRTQEVPIVGRVK